MRMLTVVVAVLSVLLTACVDDRAFDVPSVPAMDIEAAEDHMVSVTILNPTMGADVHGRQVEGSVDYIRTREMSESMMFDFIRQEDEDAVMGRLHLESLEALRSDGTYAMGFDPVIGGLGCSGNQAPAWIDDEFPADITIEVTSTDDPCLKHMHADLVFGDEDEERETIHLDFFAAFED